MSGLQPTFPGAARRRHGFTMVELIIVMVLVGILSAIAASRFFDRAGFDVEAFAEQSRALLRYAQKSAIARNTPVYVQLGDDRITLCYARSNGNCAPEDRVTAPGGSIGGQAEDTHCQSPGWYCIGRPDGVRLALSSSATEIGFDALGRPFVPGASFEGLSLSISGGNDAETRVVSVARETGYVR